MSEEKKAEADEKKYRNLSYFRTVKALTTMIRAESFLREHIMLGTVVGMFTEGAITHEKAKEALAEALDYLNGFKDDELRKWIDVEDRAINGPPSAE